MIIIFLLLPCIIKGMSETNEEINYYEEFNVRIWATKVAIINHKNEISETEEDIKLLPSNPWFRRKDKKSVKVTMHDRITDLRTHQQNLERQLQWLSEEFESLVNQEVELRLSPEAEINYEEKPSLSSILIEIEDREKDLADFRGWQEYLDTCSGHTDISCQKDNIKLLQEWAELNLNKAEQSKIELFCKSRDIIDR